MAKIAKSKSGTWKTDKLRATWAQKEQAKLKVRAARAKKLGLEPHQLPFVKDAKCPQRPTMLEVLYSALPNMSPKKRRLDVLRHFLNLMTLVEDCYEVEMRQVYQLLEASVADMNEYVSADYDKLFSLYDNLKADFSSTQKKYNEAKEASGTLSKENYELKTKNDELTLKLRSLETFSDSVLSLKIQEWLSEHKGEINIADFSKVYNVPEMRVEQMLNKLVTEGYLETKG